MRINWTPNLPIEKLIDELNEIERGLTEDQKIDDVVDMTSLPSAPIPDDIDTSYPVWAMDSAGYCLVGATADEVAHVDIIQKDQNEEGEMRDRNGMVNEIEDSLGSEGTREMAEKIFDLLRADGRIIFDEHDGFSMEKIEDREWNRILAVALRDDPGEVL